MIFEISHQMSEDTWSINMGVVGAVSCMTLVDDTFYYPLLPSNPSSGLSGLI